MVLVASSGHTAAVDLAARLGGPWRGRRDVGRELGLDAGAVVMPERRAALTANVTPLMRNSSCGLAKTRMRDASAGPIAVATDSDVLSSAIERTKVDSGTMSLAMARAAELWMRAAPELTAARAIARTSGPWATARMVSATMVAAHTRSAVTATTLRGKRSAQRLPNQVSSRAGTYRPTVATATQAVECVCW